MRTHYIKTTLSINTKDSVDVIINNIIKTFNISDNIDYLDWVDVDGGFLVYVNFEHKDYDRVRGLLDSWLNLEYVSDVYAIQDEEDDIWEYMGGEVEEYSRH